MTYCVYPSALASRTKFCLPHVQVFPILKFMYSLRCQKPETIKKNEENTIYNSSIPK